MGTIQIVPRRRIIVRYKDSRYIMYMVLRTGFQVIQKVLDERYGTVQLLNECNILRRRSTAGPFVTIDCIINDRINAKITLQRYINTCRSGGKTQLLKETNQTWNCAGNERLSIRVQSEILSRNYKEVSIFRTSHFGHNLEEHNLRHRIKTNKMYS